MEESRLETEPDLMRIEQTVGWWACMGDVGEVAPHALQREVLVVAVACVQRGQRGSVLRRGSIVRRGSSVLRGQHGGGGARVI